ncbi:hypothetical protein R1flu_027546 [Riccia fluitans]|uniref:Uncharacterized protein n=1 Tax=Riccia fluitans TaxID=41844 RepID=A0ABD1XJV0_9MARC
MRAGGTTWGMVERIPRPLSDTNSPLSTVGPGILVDFQLKIEVKGEAMMDPETERRLAAVIMEEASRLRLQAERDGVAAYLAKPAVRGRPNPQFLQATVRSIQQSNRIVEVNEMWRRRSVELEYERKRRRRHDSDRDETHYEREHGNHEQGIDDVGEEGLGDEELEEFLQSRVKRGRGAVGSRMDETGPYLPLPQQTLPGRALMPDVRVKEDWEERIAGADAGPSRPDSRERDWKEKKLKSKRSSSDSDEEEESRKRRKKHKKRKEMKKKERKERREGESRSRKKLEKTSKKKR